MGGDSGLGTASVLLSISASATRHQLNTWGYLRDVLARLALCLVGAEVGDLPRDAVVKLHGETA